MIDKYALADDLTKGFMRYQYQLDNPMTYPSDVDIINTYKHDYIFHNKVESMVGAIMQIIDKHV